MDIRIENIQLEFTKIINTTHEIKSIFDNLEIKILKLKEIYQNLIKNNNDSKFMFGLDSFRFQGKIIDLELEEMKKHNILINNRLYCEYYKLYKIMKIDIKSKFTDKKILDLTHKTYPIYKDLEIYKEYEFQNILDLHENLIEILLAISHYLKNKDLEIHKYEESNTIGFSINNFINTIKYETILIKEQALLYLNYLEFFNNIYLKYFSRFITKIKIFYSQINNDIKLEDKNLKKNMINNLESDNIDVNIINDIKNTLSSDEDNKNFKKNIINNLEDDYIETINNIENDYIFTNDNIESNNNDLIDNIESNNNDLIDNIESNNNDLIDNIELNNNNLIDNIKLHDNIDLLNNIESINNIDLIDNINLYNDLD